MKTPSPAIPETLNQYLATNSQDDVPSISRYVEGGAALVTPEAIAALHALHPALEAKIAGLDASERLQQRVDALVTYFTEACVDGVADEQASRDVTFALLYFLKGFDRIPDSVPEIGLLDDAMIVQTVLQRHSTTLRAHWLRQGRTWPADL